jgi:hypothetical protein
VSTPRTPSIRPLRGLQINYPQPGEWDDDGPAPIVLTSMPPQADLDLTPEERAFMADGDSMSEFAEVDEIPVELSEEWMNVGPKIIESRISCAPIAVRISVPPAPIVAREATHSEPPRGSIAPRVSHKTEIGIAPVTAIESATTMPPDARATLVGVGNPAPSERTSQRPTRGTVPPPEEARSQADGLVALLEAKANQQEISLPDLTPWPEPAQPSVAPPPKKVRRLPKMNRRAVLAAVVAVATIGGLLAGWQYGQLDGSSENSPDVAQETD